MTDVIKISKTHVFVNVCDVPSENDIFRDLPGRADELTRKFLPASKTSRYFTGELQVNL